MNDGTCRWPGCPELPNDSGYCAWHESVAAPIVEAVKDQTTEEDR